MIDRRTLLRLLSLSTLAVAGSGALAACAQDPQDPGLQDGGPPDTDVELVSADVPRAAGDDAAVPGLVTALHASGGALFASVGEKPGNLALSPYSIGVALALTANGAKGTTLGQLASVLGGADLATINGGLNALTAHVESLSGPAEKADGTKTEVVLDAANALFGQRGVTWEQSFLERVAESYGAGINTVDYAGDTEVARAAVNDWTAARTRDKIPEILPEGSVDGLTRLVLVNALYLKAPWETPFEKDATADGPFTLLDGSQVTVPLMRGYEPIGDASASGDGWTAARLPYAGRGVAMTVVLPDEGRFADVEAEVAGGGLAAMLDALAPDPVEVTLPSWTFRTEAPLKAALQAFGVVVPFDEAAADLSGLTTQEPLVVDDVHHQVFIAVDEQGTEAAAATAVVVRTTSAPVPGTTLVVDRPFLFVIHDVEHGTPLFLGRVVDPSV